MKQKLNCILLVDDDEATNFLSNIIIEESDCTTLVKTEQTAKAALNYLADSGRVPERSNILPFPELIFLDINMPAIDGWEFLAKYKLLKNSLQHTPVIIMLSTSLNPDDKLRALSIPEVSDFQYKPMTPEMIQSIMATHFPDYQ